jgi:hypothetical protein
MRIFRWSNSTMALLHPEKRALEPSLKLSEYNFLTTNAASNILFKPNIRQLRDASGGTLCCQWIFSVEHGKGKLSAEYVLDGRNIKVSDGSSAAAGKAVQDNLVSRSLDKLERWHN